MDKDNKHFLSLKDLIMYLQDNCVSYEEESLRRFIHNFDKDNDFALDYNEFKNIILPSSNHSLRNETEQRYTNEDNVNINTDTTYQGFIPIIKKELELVRALAGVADELKNSKDFTTYEAFVSIVNNDKYITAINLAMYLKNNGIEIEDSLISTLMHRIDSDDDGQISYDEFQEIFFPFKEFMSVSKDKYSSSYNNNINVNSTLYKSKDSTLQTYSSPYNNNDYSGCGNLNSSSNKNARKLKSIQNISEKTRRIISQSPPHSQSFDYSSVPPMQQQQQSQSFINSNYNFVPLNKRIEHVSHVQTSSPLKQNDNNNNNIIINDNDISNNDNENPLSKTTIDYRARLTTYTSPKRDALTHPLPSPKQINDISFTNQPQTHSPPLTQPNQQPPQQQQHQSCTCILCGKVCTCCCLNRQRTNNLFKLFTDIITQENTIESLKESLAYRPDANLTDIFAFFDYSQRESISIVDFAEALKEIGLYLPMNDLKLLFKKHDKNLDGRFDYNEFIEMILPRRHSIAKLISERYPPMRFVGFSNETKNALVNLFNAIIISEKSIEQNRYNLSTNPTTSVFDAFNLIKKSYCTGIYKDDLIKFMECNGKFMNAFEIEALITKLDKNNDGLISYNDFLAEVSPKY